MTYSSAILLAAASLIGAPAALAQTAPAQTTTQQQQTTPATTTSPSAPAAQAAPAAAAATAAPVTNATVTDEEVRQYATAALAVNKIRQDTSIPDAEKNPKFVQAVLASGLNANRFNAISQAMANDQELNQRIQQAAAQMQSASATPATGSTPSQM